MHATTQTIWKYQLRVRKWIRLSALPGPVRMAAIDPASGAPAIWIQHDIEPVGMLGDDTPSHEQRPTRLFGVFGTGDVIDPEDEWVGSMVDRNFIWHVFERKEG